MKSSSATPSADGFGTSRSGLKERYKQFNVSTLKALAANSVDAERCILMTKVAEGGFNEVYRLVMSNGAVVIARLRHSNLDAASHSVASELATMDFVSTVLGIPVPKVLAWSSDADNSVRSEYILMEEAAGTQLSDIWDQMEVDQKAEIADQIVGIEKQLLSVSFNHLRNIYFSDESFPGCQKAALQGPIPQHLKTKAEDRYVVGPIVESSFWDGQRRDWLDFQGPWSSPQQYLKAIANREIAWLSRYGGSAEKESKPFQAADQRSPAAHLALPWKFLAASDHVLPLGPDLTRATLWQNLQTSSSQTTRSPA